MSNRIHKTTDLHFQRMPLRKILEAAQQASYADWLDAMIEVAEELNQPNDPLYSPLDDLLIAALKEAAEKVRKIEIEQGKETLAVSFDPSLLSE
jgi:hypothetical protein